MANAFVSPVSPISGGSAGEAEAKFSWDDAHQKYSYFGLLGLVALLTYSYWNMLQGTSAFWQDDQYSHGFLMPLIAIYLAWTMRPNPAAQDPPEDVAPETFYGGIPAAVLSKGAFGLAIAAAVCYYWEVPYVPGPALAVSCLLAFAYVLIGQPFKATPAIERWIGLAILIAAYGLRVAGASMYSEPVNRYSFLIALLGGFVMVGGWSLLRWTGAAIGFLFFMFPIPSAIEQPLLLSLQKLAAYASEIVLTILSQPVVRDGNRISVDGIPLEVAEACSGLRMVTIFGGFAVACALLIRRPWWDKLIVLLSAIPIALIVNIARIVATALLYPMFDSEAAHKAIHDTAGLAMMPLAMGLLYLELKLLSLLSVEDEGLEGQGDYGSTGLFGANPT